MLSFKQLISAFIFAVILLVATFPASKTTTTKTWSFKQAHSQSWLVSGKLSSMASPAYTSKL